MAIIQVRRDKLHDAMNHWHQASLIRQFIAMVNKEQAVIDPAHR